ncbi:hypothetical protein [Mycolicibacterium thermoresistibile]
MTTTENADVEEQEVDTSERAADAQAIEPEESNSPRQLSISVRALVVAVVVAVLVCAVGVLGWLYLGAQQSLDAQERRFQDYGRAENIALDYAVHAAQIDAADLEPWKTKLVAGTSPELTDKLTRAGLEMEQILVPLQWNSTATPLAAKVRSDDGGVYVVDCFVSVLTKTVQGPEPLQSTATYSVTIDSNRDWQISDVGGVGSVVEPK